MVSREVALLLVFAQLGLCRILIIAPSPPQPNEVAKMARYIMRNSDWVSIATTSTQKAIQGYPFVSLKSVSDGPLTNSTGIPYLYMTDLDVSGQDINKDNRCTIMASLAESDYCKQKDFDPQDPRCAKLIITGKMLKIDKSSPEYQFGQDALFSKHPSMKWWPKDHDFYVSKVDIEQIAVLDFFGGIKYVSKEDYFSANETISDIPFAKVEFVEMTA
ncbi:protein CREG1 [Tribolium castaneum]|uniref:Protein CREG1-like Protein n=1 Tax=Tribolium castaneum TaxID=7070 RepID=D6WCL4_TRICA|nr:PREDICTED: protein CREG1 [Tribolium castaneum]EEZ99047.1 Protein CREG1-like Protein [Tribolium castaneum]|eukprot:XP_972946.1 PREDICTED: protein CREG1 [Tribolium castaneum]